MVDIDPLKLQAKGLTPNDIVNAVGGQALTLPSGTSKIGDIQYTVRTNALPLSIDDLNNLPVKYVNGQTVFVKDVGQVHDGNLVQQNIVRTDGHRSVLLSIIKNGNASTLSVVNAVKDALVTARKAAPSGMQIKELFDQSVFVKASITGLLREGAIAACLTALMIVVFLGSWRSTLVVMISIPLAILSSLVVLYFLGDTINRGRTTGRGRQRPGRTAGRDRPTPDLGGDRAWPSRHRSGRLGPWLVGSRRFGRNGDMFTLRFRDYPKLPKFARHRNAIALMSPPAG